MYIGWVSVCSYCFPTFTILCLAITLSFPNTHKNSRSFTVRYTCLAYLETLEKRIGNPRKMIPWPNQAISRAERRACVINRLRPPPDSHPSSLCACARTSARGENGGSGWKREGERAAERCEEKKEDSFRRQKSNGEDQRHGKAVRCTA